MSAENCTNRNQRRGAAVLLEVLRSEGARHVFGNPGTTELPLIDALVDAPDISYILALQEASAVAMADGYAQAAGRPGVLNLHTTGGLGHGLGNLLNAHVSGTPLVVTAGQQDSRHTLTDPLLYGDLVSIATPAVKWAQEVTHPDQIPILVRRAFHDCQTAPTGPVFLSLPMDVMEEMTTIDIGEVSTIDRAQSRGRSIALLSILPPSRPANLQSLPAMRFQRVMPPPKPFFSPTLWAHQSTGRPGRRTYHSLPRIHSGWAISPPRRQRFLKSCTPMTQSSRSAASR
jgi:benzoylformate decarboxylase